MATTWRCLCGQVQQSKYDKKSRPMVKCRCGCTIFLTNPDVYGGMLVVSRIIDGMEAEKPGAWDRAVQQALVEAQAERQGRRAASAPTTTEKTETKEIKA